MDPAEQFAAHVESFAAWAKHGTDSDAAAARNGLRLLTRLYLAALELPTTSGDAGADLEGGAVEDLEWKQVFGNAARLPLDFYAGVADPVDVASPQSVVGSLADDLADVYRDVVPGLRYYQAGRRDEAVWRWTTGFGYHWGRHAIDAMGVLHHWLQQNHSVDTGP